MIRQPIITVLGHVDHGKTSLLDNIRGTSIAVNEAGQITQHIGATEVPISDLKRVCGDLLTKFKLQFTIPGLLFIDTPGHEAFANLRKRGGSIADLAVLVIDINQGMQPQTIEAIEILKAFKVPFVVAATKVDMLAGWKNHSKIFTQNLEKQLVSTKEVFDARFYNLVGKLSEHGFNSELYIRVTNYTDTIAIIPVSAKTGEGMAELLAMITGLSQKFLEGKLEINAKSCAKGSILEIKEEKGMGVTADAVIYDGSLKVDDTILVGGVSEVIETKVKALLKPKPLVEIREAKKQFVRVDEVVAATGVKILANNLANAIAGSTIVSARTKEEIEKSKKDLLSEVKDILVQTDEIGIILKTDTLGSLEAISHMIKSKGIKIQRMDIGSISRKDIMDSKANAEKDPLTTFVLGFNVLIADDLLEFAKQNGVDVLTNKVIYNLLEDYEKLYESKKKAIELKKLEGLSWPAKFRILPGYVFRQSNPAVFGVEVIAGKLRPKVAIMNKEGKSLGDIKTIESEGEKLEELPQGEKAAVSVQGITIGRQVEENDIILTDISEQDFRALKARKELLAQAEINILKEIADIRRKEKETWGM